MSIFSAPLSLAASPLTLSFSASLSLSLFSTSLSLYLSFFLSFFFFSSLSLSLSLFCRLSLCVYIYIYIISLSCAACLVYLCLFLSICLSLATKMCQTWDTVSLLPVCHVHVQVHHKPHLHFMSPSPDCPFKSCPFHITILFANITFEIWKQLIEGA